MSGHDHLNHIQFHRAQEETRKDKERAKLDLKGQDTDFNFGYSEQDDPDYLYDRWGRARTTTDEKTEVF